MRVSIWAMLAIAAGLIAAPARAQTYDPRYPVCLEVRDDTGGYTECAYNSIPQCNASAAGRAAQCMVNPFFAANRPAPAAPYPRR
jgi:Protein of unknown function (DUF3551)